MSSKKYDIHVGDRFGSWEVISLVSKPGYVKCACVCGTVKDVPRNTLARGKTTSCGCGRKEALREYARKLADKQFESDQKKIGTIVNGFEILSVEKRKCYGSSKTFCKVVCLKCGREREIPLSSFQHIGICANCSGSSSRKRLPRIDGKFNANSSTKVNGVSKQKSGKYIAYITFKRKHYHLGTYDTIEDAIAARKEGEKKIQSNHDNNDLETELKSIAKESKNKNTKKLKIEREKLMQRIKEIDKLLEESEI